VAAGSLAGNLIFAYGICIIFIRLIYMYANYMSGVNCKLLKCPAEDNKALMTASYLLSVLTISVYNLAV